MDSNQEQVRVEAPGQARSINPTPSHFLGYMHPASFPRIDEEIQRLPGFVGQMRNIIIDGEPYKYDEKVDVEIISGGSMEEGLMFYNKDNLAVLGELFLII